MGVILSSCYSGLITTGLNAPRTQWRPKIWDELVCKRLSKNSVRFANGEYNISLRSEDRHILKSLNAYLDKILIALIFRRNLIIPTPTENCFRLLSLPSSYSKAGYPNKPEFLVYLTLMMIKGLRESPSKVTIIREKDRLLRYSLISYVADQYPLIINLLMPQHIHHPLDFNYGNKYNDSSKLRQSLEKEVLNCGGKTVFISQSDSVEGEYKF